MPAKLKKQNTKTLFSFWKRVKETEPDNSQGENEAIPEEDSANSNDTVNTESLTLGPVQASESSLSASDVEIAKQQKQPSNVTQLDKPANDMSNTPLASSEDKKLSVSSSFSKQYKFQESWRKENSWLRYDADKNVMYCIVCRSFDKSKKRNSFRDVGCSSFRLSNV